MAPKRSTSPTSLLWAHQLKREHACLLDRMRKLEEQMVTVEKSARSAQSSTAEKDIAALVEKVQLLSEDSGSVPAVEQFRTEIMDRLEDVQAEMEAITIKVSSSMEKNDEHFKHAQEQTSTNEAALLNHITELEKSLQDYEARLVQLGNQVDEHTLELIREQLDRITEQVQGHQASVESIHESLYALKTATEELKQNNHRLAREWERQVSGPSLAPPHAAPTHATAQVAGAAASTYGASTTWDGDPQGAREELPTLERGAGNEDGSTEKPDRPIIRAGPGWIEVARTPSAERADHADANDAGDNAYRPGQECEKSSHQHEGKTKHSPSNSKSEQQPQRGRPPSRTGSAETLGVPPPPPPPPSLLKPPAPRRVAAAAARKQPARTRVQPRLLATRHAKRKAAAALENRAPPGAAATARTTRSQTAKKPAGGVLSRGKEEERQEGNLRRRPTVSTGGKQKRKRVHRGLMDVSSSSSSSSPLSSPPATTSSSDSTLPPGPISDQTVKVQHRPRPIAKQQQQQQQQKRRRVIEQDDASDSENVVLLHKYSKQPMAQP